MQVSAVGEIVDERRESPTDYFDATYLARGEKSDSIGADDYALRCRFGDGGAEWRVLLHLAVFAEESRRRLARCTTQRGLSTSRQVGVLLRHAAVRISAVGIAVEVLELLIAVMSSSIGWDVTGVRFGKVCEVLDAFRTGDEALSACLRHSLCRRLAIRCRH